MDDKLRVLYVTQEMEPYTAISEISKVVRALPQYAQNKDAEVRILMPRYGTINERRHRLHEVVRLSGMNIIVDEDDYPLIIKVASLPGARMQVYFLDNDEFFKRKFIFSDDKGKHFEDNPARMSFFCKGVVEIVKKFGWPPNIIHCNGWITSLVPLYLKTAYKTEPLFAGSKVLYSVYEASPDNVMAEDFVKKASINDLEESDLNAYQKGDKIDLNMGAAHFADALLFSSNLEGDVRESLEDEQKPSAIINSEAVDYTKTVMDFYEELAAKVENE